MKNRMQKTSSVVILVTGFAVAATVWWASSGRKRDGPVVDGYSVHRGVSVADIIGSKIMAHIKPIMWGTVAIFLVFKIFSPTKYVKEEDTASFTEETASTPAEDTTPPDGSIMGVLRDFFNPMLSDVLKATTGDADWVAPSLVKNNFSLPPPSTEETAAAEKVAEQPTDPPEQINVPEKEWSYSPGESRAPPLASPYITGKRSSYGEEECRRVLEKVFDCKFPSVRPRWLRNPESNMPLELDCYNSDYGIAVEYQGEQHYRFVPKFHASQDEFARQKRRDAYKRLLCQKNNIHLIEVPYWVSRSAIEEYLIQELRKIGAVV